MAPCSAGARRSSTATATPRPISGYKFGINLNTDAKQAVIIRKPMEYMLPDDGVNKNYVLAREDFFFVYPTRFHEFERQYRGSFQHGGISIEEMILPMLTLTPRGRDRAVQRTSSSEAETMRLGAALGAWLEPGDVIGLEGHSARGRHGSLRASPAGST